MKKFTLLVLSLSLVLSSLTTFANAANTSFTDVPEGAWYYNAVTQCAANGYVSGVGNNKFAPEGKLTYAQIFTMFTNAFFKSEKQDYENNRYLEMDAYFGGNPQWWSYNAYYFMDNGLLEGTDVNIKSTASVSEPISRYDVVQIANNILKSKGISVSDSDRAAAQAKISDWSSVPANYRESVATCFSLGIISGYPGNRFVGTDTLTRAQACVILNSLVKVVAEGGSVKPADKPSVPSETTKNVEVTTLETQWGVGYYVKDNGFGDGYLNNGKPITEANVLEMLEEAQRIWLDGISWKERATYDNHWYEFSGPVVDSVLLNKYRVSTNYACGGFAAMLSDYLFGQNNNPFHRVYDPMDIRAGDVIIYKDNGTATHVAIAQTSTIQSGTYAGRLWIADGNVSDKVSWSTAIKQQYSSPTSEARQAQFNPGRTWEVWSRYPA